MNLTDEPKTALNVGLAMRLDGWQKSTEYPDTFKRAIWKDGIVASGNYRGEEVVSAFRLPTYCSDLNAIHRLEERLTDEEWSEYDWQLCLLLEFKSDEPTYRRLIHASAEQRAIALARTLNIQIEGVTQ